MNASNIIHTLNRLRRFRRLFLAAAAAVAWSLTASVAVARDNGAVLIHNPYPDAPFFAVSADGQLLLKVVPTSNNGDILRLNPDGTYFAEFGSANAPMIMYLRNADGGYDETWSGSGSLQISTSAAFTPSSPLPYFTDERQNIFIHGDFTDKIHGSQWKLQVRQVVRDGVFRLNVIEFNPK